MGEARNSCCCVGKGVSVEEAVGAAAGLALELGVVVGVDTCANVAEALGARVGVGVRESLGWAQLAPSVARSASSGMAKRDLSCMALPQL